MSPTFKQLLADALRLPDDDRTALAAEILRSLPPAAPGAERADDAWVADVERRARAALAGEPGVPMAEALSSARAGLQDG